LFLKKQMGLVSQTA